MSWITPIRIQGKHVTLLPLKTDHCASLIEAAKDGELWTLWYATVPSPKNMAAEIERRLELQNKGEMLPFTVIDNNSGLPVGMTTYLNLSAPNKRLEIGWTWYRQNTQKTAVNTECKLMLLTHAFETLQCVAVRLGANSFNQNSRRAIERIGAKFEGTLRNYRIMPNGKVCDFCFYSIIDSEWPLIKSDLKSKLSKQY